MSAYATAWADEPTEDGIILDLFAGPGGWSVGAQMLGIRDVGIEWDWAACLTRRAAGHLTIQADVAQYPTGPLVAKVRGLIGSPSCTKFSSAGKGVGRRCLDILGDGIVRLFRGEDCREQVRERIYAVALAEHQAANEKAASEKKRTAEQLEKAARDDAYTTALVLEPARYIADLLRGGGPLEWVALEQVASVLPLWKVYAHCLRELGWSVWCGVLNTADYGVPQTRERAILAASRVRTVTAPEPTHAKQAEPESFFGPGRLKWISMAEALGWDDGGIVNTRGDRKTPGGNEFPADRPSWALTEKTRSWVLHTNRNQQPDGTRQTTDPHGAPAPTLTAKSGGQWVLRTGNNTMKHSRTGSRRGEGGVVAYERDIEEPAPTLDTNVGNKWTLHRPATTVCATDRIAPPGHRDRNPGGESQFASPDTVRITIEEAAVLQSFPADYPWQGTKTKKFEQAGNAVPPLLAAHVLSAATGIPMPATRTEVAA